MVIRLLRFVAISVTEILPFQAFTRGAPPCFIARMKLSIPSNSSHPTFASSYHRHVPPTKPILVGAAAAALLLIARPVLAKHDGRVGSIIVIAMENHNFTQPDPTSPPQQILGNPAAPYINSLVTPGNPNAAQTSFATSYHNAGVGVHPSEPNYVWAEAGTDFGVHTDADPAPAKNNVFNGVHLTGQLNAAGISWKNYQEDVQLSVAPTTSASGTNGPVNPFNGTTQFNYAVKHNPMAFFPNSALRNVFPLSQFFQDLGNNAIGKYNWITPDQFNDSHSALTGGFTYQGTLFTGDQASIAQGDNFLSMIVPQIMASDAYEDNGVIIIWWDESEGGDDPTRTIPEIVISHLAKGNAFASTAELNHSSDLKTMEEVFGLPFVNNPIPATETSATGTGFNYVATVNDLSDLFVPGAIPASPSFSVTSDAAAFDPQTNHAFQVVHIENTGTSTAPAPLFLVLDNLAAGVSLVNADGITAILPPIGSPFVTVKAGDDGVLRPHESKVVKLEFLDPGNAAITYGTRVLSVTPAP
jgi:phosphatidylinositol-3-phosphatase